MQVPVLADTLRADTADVIHGVAKHDMAEAIEHVVRGIGDVKEELHKAFLARDVGLSGALGGPAFKVRGRRQATTNCKPFQRFEDINYGSVLVSRGVGKVEKHSHAIHTLNGRQTAVIPPPPPHKNRLRDIKERLKANVLSWHLHI